MDHHSCSPPDFPQQLNDDDIYRGQSHSTYLSQASASSSSLSSVASGRLGAISSIVELAISRWARGNQSSSSLSSSSSSARLARRRGRRRCADDHNALSGDAVVRLKTLRNTRQVPREFALYVPSALRVPASASSKNGQQSLDECGSLKTHLLPTILSRLNATLKASARLRQRKRKQPTRTDTDSLESTPRRVPSGADIQEFIRNSKGKQRECHVETPPPTLWENSTAQQPSWWLDVSSPFAEDMRVLGNLLHLHPLTLEDIISRDPREKLEIFPKLGYYFIVFKSIESDMTLRTLENIAHNDPDNPELLNKGVVHEDLVYLVVFRGGEGLCTFHYNDISEHLDHVREKVLLRNGCLNKSSDWIAHGILDSIVDSFFPFLNEIEKEVVYIEGVVYAGNCSQDTAPEPIPNSMDETPETLDSTTDKGFEEKLTTPSVTVRSVESRSRTPTSITSFLGRMKNYLSKLSLSKAKNHVALSTSLVYRMARVRRLVTSLMRLLSAKADLIAQIKKRLLTNGEWTLGTDPELYIHLGDILDHILTFQQALVDYDRILSNSYKTYLHNLHVAVTKTKYCRNRGVITLTTVSVGVAGVQTLIGLFSLNVTLPTDPSSYRIFGIFIVGAIVQLLIYSAFVRWVWIKAKRKQRNVLY